MALIAPSRPIRPKGSVRKSNLSKKQIEVLKNRAMRSAKYGRSSRYRSSGYDGIDVITNSILFGILF